MNRTCEKLLYYFDNDISNEIIEKYRLDKFCVFDDENTIKGLNELCKITIQQLEFYRLNDLSNILLYLESVRFLPYLLGNQKKEFNLMSNYYKNILKYFHSHKLLTFKKEYKPYKNFIKKIPIMEIKYNANLCSVYITYYSFNCLKNDYGRYKAEKLMRLRDKDKFTFDYDEINTIINS